MTGRAIQSECPNRTTISGSCRCQPKCKVCGYGPHMGVHMGTKADPTLAFDHEYQPKTTTEAADQGERGGTP